MTLSLIKNHIAALDKLIEHPRAITRPSQYDSSYADYNKAEQNGWLHEAIQNLPDTMYVLLY